MPTKRVGATDDRNRAAVQLAGLAFGPLLFCSFEPSGS
jgi:hypothetical protein